MRFAKRTGWDLSPNRLAQKRDELRNCGVPFVDLTESNPTQTGIRYPDGLLTALSHPRGLLYEPSPKGLVAAREAVASIFAAKGSPIDPEEIVLTSSTSEAYSHLFRLLADPGDDLLVPQPSYPLFDYLADLHDVRPAPYRLRLGSKKRWELDLESLAGAASERSRALIAVHPNNPTGSCFNAAEREAVFRFCRQRGLALISDEVFSEYLIAPEPGTPLTLLGANAGLLTFALGGLSKWMGLPQMKLAWIAASGPPSKKREALAKLEMIADTALSVNTPAQRALPEWIKTAQPIRAEIIQRLKSNRQTLRSLCEGSRIRQLPYQGGWTAVLQVPLSQDEESWAVDLLEKHGVLVHPGYLFGFEIPGVIVISLLTPPEAFADGTQRLLDHSAA